MAGQLTSLFLKLLLHFLLSIVALLYSWTIYALSFSFSFSNRCLLGVSFFLYQILCFTCGVFKLFFYGVSHFFSALILIGCALLHLILLLLSFGRFHRFLFQILYFFCGIKLFFYGVNHFFSVLIFCLIPCSDLFCIYLSSDFSSGFSPSFLLGYPVNILSSLLMLC